MELNLKRNGVMLPIKKISIFHSIIKSLTELYKDVVHNDDMGIITINTGNELPIKLYYKKKPRGGIIIKIDSNVICKNDLPSFGTIPFRIILPDNTKISIQSLVNKTQFSMKGVFDSEYYIQLKGSGTTFQTLDMILKREIKKVTDNVLGKEKIQKIYEKTEDKRILVLDDSYSWKKIVSSFPETVFVIKQVYENKNWHLNAVTEEGFKFKNKVDLPEVWAGKDGEELEKITGIKGALFCHNKRFMCAAKTKEAAVELAKLALANSKSESSKL